MESKKEVLKFLKYHYSQSPPSYLHAFELHRKLQNPLPGSSLIQQYFEHNGSQSSDLSTRQTGLSAKYDSTLFS